MVALIESNLKAFFLYKEKCVKTHLHSLTTCILPLHLLL